ncbi:MAG: hypothetical protein ACD_30C00014G0010 [uncultured bacterium]|nr:MAG: hypothetical protein ACD_30C00014G0010 [uncultured bacterium]
MSNTQDLRLKSNEAPRQHAQFVSQIAKPWYLLALYGFADTEIDPFTHA